MEELLTNELLSEVLGFDVKNVYTFGSNTNLSSNELMYDVQGKGDLLHINKYELEHLCKEYVLNNSFYITTHPILTELKWRHTSVVLMHFYSSGMDRSISLEFKNHRVEAASEFEAVIKATKWVIDNKDSYF